MKLLLLLCLPFMVMVLSVHGQANTKLSNLVSPTAVNQHLLPGSTNARDIGSSSYAWRNQYLRGYVYLDGTRFLSNHPGTANANAFMGSHAGLAITTGYANTALGNNALRTATIGSGNTAVGASALYSNNGSYNTAVGDSAMYAANSSNNTAVGFMSLGKATPSGSINTAIGYQSLTNNTSGSENVALGHYAMRANTTGYLNTAIGTYAMLQSTSGTQNVAVGRGSLQRNNGQMNVALGNESMAGNYNGSFTIAIGFRTLQNTQGAQYNTVIGYLAGAKYDNGYNNVFLGANTDVNGPGYYNVIAIGQGTICTAPSQVTMGNPATSSYRAYSFWSNISDGRYKRNVKEDVPGLSFINKLRPVTYTLDASGLDQFLNRGRERQPGSEAQAVMQKALKAKEAVVQTGFVAQEVEKAARELGYNFSGIQKPGDDKDVYGLSYSEFVVPLVKAVQELHEKDKEIDNLKAEVAELRQMMLELKKESTNAVTTMAGSLEQNFPNPVRSSTRIAYSLPEGVTKAYLQITDALGRTIKTQQLNTAGVVHFDASALSKGVYNYSLLVGNKTLQAKKMTVVK